MTSQGESARASSPVRASGPKVFPWSTTLHFATWRIFEDALDEWGERKYTTWGDLSMLVQMTRRARLPTDVAVKFLDTCLPDWEETMRPKSEYADNFGVFKALVKRELRKYGEKL